MAVALGKVRGEGISMAAAEKADGAGVAVDETLDAEGYPFGRQEEGAELD